MEQQIADWFAKLIDDRPGNFAMRIVEALQGEGITLPLELSVNSGPDLCLVIIVYHLNGRRFVIHRYPGGPVCDWLGHPATWTKLHAFRNATELDRAFRGCDQTFAADLT